MRRAMLARCWKRSPTGRGLVITFSPLRDAGTAGRASPRPEDVIDFRGGTFPGVCSPAGDGSITNGERLGDHVFPAQGRWDRRASVPAAGRRDRFPGSGLFPGSVRRPGGVADLSPGLFARRVAWLTTSRSVAGGCWKRSPTDKGLMITFSALRDAGTAGGASLRPEDVIDFRGRDSSRGLFAGRVAWLTTSPGLFAGGCWKHHQRAAHLLEAVSPVRAAAVGRAPDEAGTPRGS
jgi:hypothetical protein